VNDTITQGHTRFDPSIWLLKRWIDIKKGNFFRQKASLIASILPFQWSNRDTILIEIIIIKNKIILKVKIISVHSKHDYNR